MPQNPWSHSICDDCYAMHFPYADPFRFTDPQKETCCFCGQSTQSGIYVRHDPDTLRCHGEHQNGSEASP